MILKSTEVWVRQAAWVCKREGLLKLTRKIFRHLWKLPIWISEDLRWFALASRSRNSGVYISKTLSNTLYLNPHDYGISKELAIYHTHEPLATKMLQNLMKKGMVVVDIGANIGYYVLLESSAVGDLGKVIAIEPDLVNFKFLNLNVKKNGLGNVSMISAAMGDYDGVGEMYQSEFSNLHSFIATSRVKQETISVPVYTLDALMEKIALPVDLIRMDVEGYETSIVKGAKRTLEKYMPILMMELHTPTIGKNNTEKLLKELEALGYGKAYVIEREKDFAWFPCDLGIHATRTETLLAKMSLLNDDECMMLFFMK